MKQNKKKIITNKYFALNLFLNHPDFSLLKKFKKTTTKIRRGFAFVASHFAYLNSKKGVFQENDSKILIQEK